MTDTGAKETGISSTITDVSVGGAAGAVTGIAATAMLGVSSILAGALIPILIAAVGVGLGSLVAFNARR